MYINVAYFHIPIIYYNNGCFDRCTDFCVMFELILQGKCKALGEPTPNMSKHMIFCFRSQESSLNKIDDWLLMTDDWFHRWLIFAGHSSCHLAMSLFVMWFIRICHSLNVTRTRTANIE